MILPFKYNHTHRKDKFVQLFLDALIHHYFESAWYLSYPALNRRMHDVRYSSNTEPKYIVHSGTHQRNESPKTWCSGIVFSLLTLSSHHHLSHGYLLIPSGLVFILYQ